MSPLFDNDGIVHAVQDFLTSEKMANSIVNSGETAARLLEMFPDCGLSALDMRSIVERIGLELGISMEFDDA